jgi:hypothetical protein
MLYKHSVYTLDDMNKQLVNLLAAYDATLWTSLCSNVSTWRGLYSPCSSYCKPTFLPLIFFFLILIFATETYVNCLDHGLVHILLKLINTDKGCISSAINNLSTL